MNGVGLYERMNGVAGYERSGVAGCESSGGAGCESSENIRVIGIVGGGLSGALVAIQLLRKATAPLRVVLIEPRAEVGRGIAYSTSSPSHLLNVRAGNMSIFPDEPQDFLNYLRSAETRDYSGRDFVPRERFGAYVGERLRRARRVAARGVSFEHITDRAGRIDRVNGGGLRVVLEGGSELAADAVVLAVGNNPPATPFEASAGAEVVSGWSTAAFEGLGKDEPVLVVGSGLTAVDSVLELDDRGHRGAIHVISRHGRWPLVHGSPPPLSGPPSSLSGQPPPLSGSPAPLGGPPPPVSGPPLVFGPGDSVLTILRTLRAGARQAGIAEDSWQLAFDQIRPHINSIWRRLPAIERRRFLRHARGLWEIHRHRMPPEAAARIAALSQSGQLVTQPGRVLGATRMSDGLTNVAIATSNRKDIARLAVRRVIICTGPDLDFRRGAPPVIRELIDDNLAQLDSSNLGLSVSESYALLEENGRPSSSLFALGPVIKGSLWETTALPEIRVQARDLAEHLLGILVQEPVNPEPVADSTTL
jgi:uncharacterized NAD(P)/FAD-binding protein YdhS